MASRSINSLFALINRSTNSNLVSDDYVLSLPLFNNGDFNTKIIIKPKVTKRLYGNFTFYYNRVTLSDIEEVSVNLGNSTTLHQLFEQLNREPFYFTELKRNGEPDIFRIPGILYEEEFVNLTIPPIAVNKSITMNLKPISNSYLFTGLASIKITNYI